MDRHKKTTCPVCRKKIDSKVCAYPWASACPVWSHWGKVIKHWAFNKHKQWYTSKSGHGHQVKASAKK